VIVGLGAYLIGGIPFGYLVARGRGVDILHQGSGNIGATNVGRLLGRRFGILVFLLDFAKGAGPAAVGLFLGRQAEAEWGAVGPQIVGVTAGLCALLGHLFPIYLRFRGGKGVATGAGVVAVLLPLPLLAGLFTWLTVLCAERYVSLASLAAAATLCMGQLVLVPDPLAAENLPATIFCCLAAALVFWRHRANLGRLRQGTENRLRDTVAMNTLTRALHQVVLGIWLGTIVFFTFVVGLVLFSRFESLGEDAAHRPLWFPLSTEFQHRDAQIDGPREQGTRAAGEAVTPLLPWYFLIQGVCGFLAVGTALGLARFSPGRVQRLRVQILLLALLTVLVGWPLEHKVSALRRPRYDAVDAFLQSPPESVDTGRAAALQAKSEFGMWHGLSLLLNLATVGLVTSAMVLAAWLPAASEPRSSLEKPGQGAPS